MRLDWDTVVAEVVAVERRPIFDNDHDRGLAALLAGCVLVENPPYYPRHRASFVLPATCTGYCMQLLKDC
jgi:hypothetical protein